MRATAVTHSKQSIYIILVGTQVVSREPAVIIIGRYKEFQENALKVFFRQFYFEIEYKTT